jgi:hypothetical protein
MNIGRQGKKEDPGDTEKDKIDPVLELYRPRTVFTTPDTPEIFMSLSRHDPLEVKEFGNPVNQGPRMFRTGYFMSEL